MAKKLIARKTKRDGIRVGSPSDYPDIDFEEIEKDADEQWEKRQRGQVKQPKIVPPTQAAKLDKMIDDALNLSSVTIRFQSELIQDFKRFAHEDGIGYQPLMRMVLTKYAVDRKKK
jgi:predicted DNA binding CopG/RHH family protein